VKQNSSNFVTGLEGTLFGQAYVANVNTGTVFAYNAVNDPDEADVYDFDYNASFDYILSFLPETYASTMWYIFPVDKGVDLTTDIAWDYAFNIGDGSGDINPLGIFDNNESLKSGTRWLMAGCWDTAGMDTSNDGEPIDPGSGPVTANFFYTLSQIMSGAQYNAVKGTGGWTEFYSPDAEPHVYKFQSSTVFGKTMTIMISEPSTDSFYSYTK
jgi:hypothetical protein